jgi:alpha-tubulin suppressor-like RCC1 family protein
LLSLGAESSCASVEALGLWCWGRGGEGQLADLQKLDRWVPTRALFANPTSVAVGGTFACAITREGSLWCWGRNLAISPDVSPMPVLLNETLRSVTAGQRHSCGLDAQGGVWCWGEGGSGQLGRSVVMTESFAIPMKVSLPLPATKVVAGAAHSCALLSNDSVTCWGRGTEGQLGNGLPDTQLLPMVVPGVAAVGIAAGRNHTCSFTAAGLMQCWGENTSGQLADGTTRTAFAPVGKSTLKVKQLALGGSHSCSTDSSGAVFCWGDDSRGQLGTGAVLNRNEPVPVSLLCR